MCGHATSEQNILLFTPFGRSRTTPLTTVNCVNQDTPSLYLPDGLAMEDVPGFSLRWRSIRQVTLIEPVGK
jgi:hypothetical protein